MDVSFPTERALAVVNFGTSAPPLTGRRKTMAKKQKTGGFESMDLLPEIYRALKFKGYQLPTPVQRKTLPLALAGAKLITCRACSPSRASAPPPVVECGHCGCVSGR
jgi:ATP-dependent RNA helicase DDX54/DBP10